MEENLGQPIVEPVVSGQSIPQQKPKVNKIRVVGLIAFLILVLVAMGAAALFYSLGTKTVSVSPATTTTANVTPQVSPTTSATVSSTTGNSDSQLGKDSATVDNNLKNVDSELNNFDKALNENSPSDLSQ